MEFWREPMEIHETDLSNDDYPRCAKCGSHNLGKTIKHRYGFATFLGILSTLLSTYTSINLGFNLGFIHDLHKGDYCKNCGSWDILYEPPKKKVKPEYLPVAIVAWSLFAVMLFLTLMFLIFAIR